MLAKHALYQLSYGPNHEAALAVSLSPTVRPRITQSVVGPGRLELPTSRLSGVCSNQLSYRPLKRLVPGLGPGTRDRTTASRTAAVFYGKRNEDGDTPHLCSVYDEPIEPREVLEAHP